MIERTFDWEWVVRIGIQPLSQCPCVYMRTRLEKHIVYWKCDDVLPNRLLNVKIKFNCNSSHAECVDAIDAVVSFFIFFVVGRVQWIHDCYVDHDQYGANFIFNEEQPIRCSQSKSIHNSSTKNDRTLRNIITFTDSKLVSFRFHLSGDFRSPEFCLINVIQSMSLITFE